VKRSAQDTLAERRSVIQEQRREPDQMARAILQFQLDELDRELADAPEGSPTDQRLEQIRIDSQDPCAMAFLATDGSL